MSKNAKTKTRMTILLVEDHPDTRESMEAWLDFEGYEVITAADMKSAVKVAREKAFDLLLCDWQLPDGDGGTVLGKLPGHRKVLAVAISGHGAAADLARSKQAGFFAHLVKPFSTVELEQVLRAAQCEMGSNQKPISRPR